MSPALLLNPAEMAECKMSSVGLVTLQMETVRMTPQEVVHALYTHVTSATHPPQQYTHMSVPLNYQSKNFITAKEVNK